MCPFLTPPGLCYTRPDRHDKLEVKGLTLVRRDSCQLVRLASTEVLDAIMHKRDPALAVDIARGHVLRLLRDEVPLDLLEYSKALRGTYKNDKQPHLRVAQKIHARRGYPVPSGERVRYVLVETPLAVNVCDKAECPDHVREHALRVDALSYLDALLSSLERLLAHLVDGRSPTQMLLTDPDVAELVVRRKERTGAEAREAKRVRTNAVNKQAEITRFFTRPGNVTSA